jgi:predicted nucleic acid-binding protein
MKFLILDAGPIISLTMNGMLKVLERLKDRFDGEFIITPQVKREVIDKPMKIKKYKFEALQVQDLLDRGVLKLSSEFISNSKLDAETARMLKISNSILSSSNTGEKIQILHEGEASCMAFSNLCRGDNLLVVDERTTRVITEAPQNLESLMEKKLHAPLDANMQKIKDLGKFKIIRSAELVYVAYKKKQLALQHTPDVLDGLLYALKFKGTAISTAEIEEMKRLA